MAAIERNQAGQSKSSLEAAAEAAAKVNAMLIAKGKLKPSQLIQPQVTTAVVTTSTTTPTKAKPIGSTPNSLIVAEVEINDVPICCRNLLTRGSTQEEISKSSGAAVSTRGRFMNPEERMKFMGDPKEKPLYLCVQGPTQESVDSAVNRINDTITNGMRSKGTRFSPAIRPQGDIGGMRPHVHQPPPMVALSPQPTTLSFVQEKLFIGLEHAPPSFDVKSKILGPGGSYLQHIQNETAAKVILRGKGSGFLEPTSGREAFEPMHIHLQHPAFMGLQQAKQLAENLIQTVQQDYAQFQQALAAMPPTVSPGTATLLASLHHQTSVASGQQGIPTYTTVAQQPLTQVPQPGLQTMSSLANLAAPTHQVLPASSLSSMVLPVSLANVPPPTLVTQAPGLVSTANRSGLVIPATLATSLTPVPLVTSIFTAPLLAAGAGPPPPNAGAQIDASGQYLPNASLPPPLLQASSAHGINQYGASAADPHYLGSSALGGSQPAQVLVGQPQQQQLAPVGMPFAGTSQIAHQVAAPMGPPLASTLQHGMQLVSQPGLPPSVGQPPHAYFGQYSGSAAQPISLAASGVVSPIPASATYTLASSGYTYTVGPSKEDAAQPQKRRFMEEKPEDKLPENLLGYQHGPPHLTNLVASGPPPSQTPQSLAAPLQQPYQQSAFAITEELRPQTYGAPQTSPTQFMPPPPQGVAAVSEKLEVDKQLMPPPPPPDHVVPWNFHPGSFPREPLPTSREADNFSPIFVGDNKRGGHSGSEPERKKMKGALGSVAVYGSDDEEEESNSPGWQQQQQREGGKISLMQSGGKPQAFSNQLQDSSQPNQFEQFAQNILHSGQPQQYQFSPPRSHSPGTYQTCSSPIPFPHSPKQNAQTQRNSHDQQNLSPQTTQFNNAQRLVAPPQTTFSGQTVQLQPFVGHTPQHHFNGQNVQPGFVQQFSNQPPQHFGAQTVQVPPFQPPPPGIPFWMAPN